MTISIKLDNAVWIVSSSLFDLQSTGYTKEVALQNLIEDIEEFTAAAYSMGTLNKCIEEKLPIVELL